MATTTRRPLLSVGGATADLTTDELDLFVREVAHAIAGTGARGRPTPGRG